jgi:hypothetical protein
MDFIKNYKWKIVVTMDMDIGKVYINNMKNVLI